MYLCVPATCVEIQTWNSLIASCQPPSKTATLRLLSPLISIFPWTLFKWSCTISVVLALSCLMLYLQELPVKLHKPVIPSLLATFQCSVWWLANQANCWCTACLFICAHEWAYVCTCMHMCVHGSQRTTLGLVPQVLVTFSAPFLDSSSHHRN